MRWGRLRIGAMAAFLATLAGMTVAVSSKVERPNPTGKPQRIMSTNLCSDILLLMLVSKDRIASVTYLAHDPVEVLMPGADAGVAINHGSVEEVVAQRPDLILASPWSASVMRRLASSVGAPLVEVDAANSFEDIRRITRQVGAAVGEPQRAEALIAEMDARLALLERDRPARPIEVAAWSSGDAVPGSGTLTDEIIERAGAVNLARRRPDASYSTFGVEELLAARPDVIMRGEDRYDAPALRDAVSEHPAIRKAYAGRRIAYPASLYACGLPQSADAALQLRAALAEVPQGSVTW